MTRNFLFTLFFIFSAFSFFAQGTTVYSPQLINNTAPFPGESCASEYAENEFLKDPAYAQTRANLEAQIQQYIQQKFWFKSRRSCLYNPSCFSRNAFW